MTFPWHFGILNSAQLRSEGATQPGSHDSQALSGNGPESQGERTGHTGDTGDMEDMEDAEK